MSARQTSSERLRLVGRLAVQPLVEAWHARFFVLLAVEIAAALLLAALFGESALTEGREIRIGVLAALLRVAMVLSIALFVISSLLREFADGGALVWLSLPISRAGYLVGRFLGFAALSLAGVALSVLALAPLAEPGALGAWGFSLFLESLIVAAFGLLCAIGLRQIPQAFAITCGFYLLARSVGTFEAIASHQGGGVEGRIAEWVLSGLAYLLPALDRFSLSSWLGVGPPGAGELLGLLAQAAVYVALLLSAALFDLYRREL